MARREEHFAERQGRAGCPAVETAAAVSPSSSRSNEAVEEDKGTAEPAIASSSVDRPDPSCGRPCQG